MEHAEIGEASKSVSSRRLKSRHTVRLSSKPLKNRRSGSEAFDLSSATEEVIEAVFSGSSYVPVSSAMSSSAPLQSHPHQPKTRKTCYVVLDVAPEDDWVYCFPVGSWRRIVMNVFGNAIKYTDSGHVHVSLRASEGSRATGAPTTVILTITDSGIGMSPQFLANKAFQPFSQENSVRHAPETQK
jgi:signal transduction histidine kinase